MCIKVISNFLESDHRNKIEIENPINLDPLQTNELILRTQTRN
jgi:hypothetical protein